MDSMTHDESPHIVGYLDSAESADAVLRHLQNEGLPSLKVAVVEVSPIQSSRGEFSEATLYWAWRGALIGTLIALMMLLPTLVIPQEGTVPGWPWLILIACIEGAFTGAALSALAAGIGTVCRWGIRTFAGGEQGRRPALALYARGNASAIRHVAEVLREYGASRIDECR